MNLHNIKTPVRPPLNVPEWVNTYFTPDSPRSHFWGRVDEMNARTLDNDTIRASLRDWFQPEHVVRANEGLPPRRETSGYTLLAEIARFRDRLMMAGFRQAELDRFAFRVSPEEYRTLLDYIPQEGSYRGPTFDYRTGMMSVMGVAVLLSR